MWLLIVYSPITMIAIATSSLRVMVESSEGGASCPRWPSVSFGAGLMSVSSPAIAVPHEPVVKCSEGARHIKEYIYETIGGDRSYRFVPRVK